MAQTVAGEGAHRVRRLVFRRLIEQAVVAGPQAGRRALDVTFHGELTAKGLL